MDERQFSEGVVRVVGRRVEPKLCLHASGEALKNAAAFNETLQSAFPYGRLICCPKGIYRFKTHEEANRHQEIYIANTVAMITELSKTKKDGDNA